MSVKSNHRIFKEPNIINFPDDFEPKKSKPSVFELLMQHKGDYKKVSKILDEKIEETNHLINDLTVNVKEMPSDVFEEKLNKLKSDNLQTMMLCEEFRKISARKENQRRSLDGDGDRLGDDKKRLYDKPPIPKVHKSVKDGVNHDTHYNEWWKTENGGVRRSWTENDENFDRVEDSIKRREQTYKREAAMDRLTRPKSNLSNYYERSDLDDLHDPDFLVEKWRHRVTVPQPFQMTLREEVKQKHLDYLSDNNSLRKSRSLLQFEMEKADKEQQELEESKKQFKANPVPGHVYVPLYSSMQEEANQKRQLNREYNKELLKSMEKPFSFYKRDLEKQKSKPEMVEVKESEKSLRNGVKPGSSKVPLKSYHGERQATIFRAKPIPKYSVESSAMEKMKEDDLYRQIKIEMRSKKLMEESKLPGNMEERQRQLQEKRSRNGGKKKVGYSVRQRSQSADSARPKRSVPDFSKIHQRWEEEIRMSYKEPQVTQTRPFNLLTEKRPANRVSSNVVEPDPVPTNYPTMRTDDWNKSIIAALEMAKPSTNKSTMLRETSTKNKLLEDEVKRHQKEMEKLGKKKREEEVAQMIRKSLELDQLPKNRDKQRQKVKKLRVEDEKKKEEYHQNLGEMHQRVRQRHLLLEHPPRRPPTSVKGGKEPSEGDYGPPRGSGKFADYDERNQFGDASSYRSSTEASGTMVSADQPQHSQYR